MRAEFMHRITLVYIGIEFASGDQPVDLGSLLGNFIFQFFNFGKFVFNIQRIDNLPADCKCYQ